MGESKNNDFHLAPSHSTLCKYISAGIKLIPTKLKSDGSFFQLKDGDTIISIDTKEGLQTYLQNDVERFLFIPKNAGFLCIDIDRNHNDGIDGLENFKTWLQKECFCDEKFSSLPESFPTYVATPSGGVHLYFKCNSNGNLNSTLLPGVEIKYGGRNLTAGGSVKNGKPYVLHGNLCEAPELSYRMLNRLYKKNERNLQPPPPQRTYIYEKKHYEPEQYLDYVRQDHPNEGNHYRIFYFALRLKSAGYSEQETINIIQSTPEHCGRDHKNDTLYTVRSVFKF